MSYYHFQSGVKLGSLESFLLFLPFQIKAAGGNNHFTIAPIAEDEAYAKPSAVTLSSRRSPPAGGKRNIASFNVDNPTQSLSDSATPNEGNRIYVNGCQLTKAACHLDQLSFVQCELASTSEGANLPFFDLSKWNKEVGPPANPGTHVVWKNSIESTSKPATEITGWTCDFLWDLSPTRSAQDGFTSELGIMAPLSNSGSLMRLIQDFAVHYRGNPGDLIDQRFPSFVIKSDVLEDVRIFENEDGTDGVVDGYVAIAAGAFAPPSPKSFGYKELLEIFKLDDADLLDRLDGLAIANQQLRSGLDKSDFGQEIGSSAPVEIIYFSNLQSTRTPAFF